MSLPLAHAFLGGSLTAVTWPVKAPADWRRGLWAGALLGICPDVDYLINLIRVFGTGWHHGVTHSVLFALVVGTGASWGFGVRGWRGALVCIGAVLTHALLDYLTTYSGGLLLFWPVTDQRFKLGIQAWSYYRFAGDSQGWSAILKVAAIELPVFGALFAISVRWRVARVRGA